MTDDNYSVLRSWRVRPLPVALAHQMVRTGGNNPHKVTLLRLCSALSAGQRAECQAELARCSRWRHRFK